ncbi:hypothetical protein DM860_015017 [Cuscuta australis]|uniref:Uncharacterized protein n=1 Tax=Cuscuta australis TaxID=267555 RepID=A0A328DF58_9ASTE|nr:hypothetical protein DM860_015017 [Cuscuta australis]
MCRSIVLNLAILRLGFAVEDLSMSGLMCFKVICFKETCKLYFIPSSGSVTLLFICSIVSTDSAELVKQVPNATYPAAKDGTTCATVLTREIHTEGCKELAAGVNVMDLHSGIIKVVKWWLLLL